MQGVLNKVLYFEEDSSNLVQMTLEEDGQLNIWACETWDEAVKMAHEQKPDLLLLEVALPKKKGVESLRTLRKTEILADIPAIFLTVNTELTSIDDNEGLGLHSVIYNSFLKTTLSRNIIKEWERIVNSEKHEQNS